MSKVLSMQEKKNRKAIELMFADLDDDFMKNALLCAYGGEDPAILDEIVKQQKEDYEKMIAEMKISNIEEIVMPKEELDKRNLEILNSQQNIDDGNKTD
jgi:hypothetical protein